MPTWTGNKESIYRLGKQGKDATVASVVMVHLIEAACLFLYKTLMCGVSFLPSFLGIVFVCFDKGRQNKLECCMMLYSNCFLPFEVPGKNVFDL